MKEWNDKALEDKRKEEMIAFDKAREEFAAKAAIMGDDENEVEISEEENAPDYDCF